MLPNRIDAILDDIVMSNRMFLISLPAFIPLAVAALLLYQGYDQLPDPYPHHWNIRGQPDAFSPKTFSNVFMVLGFGLATQLATAIAIYASSRQADVSKRPHAVLLPVVMWFMSLMFTTIALTPLFSRDASNPFFLPFTVAGTAVVLVVAWIGRRKRPSSES